MLQSKVLFQNTHTYAYAIPAEVKPFASPRTKEGLWLVQPNLGGCSLTSGRQSCLPLTGRVTFKVSLTVSLPLDMDDKGSGFQRLLLGLSKIMYASREHLAKNKHLSANY